MPSDDLRPGQAQRLPAQELEAAGQLLTGIAHEVNTPVQYATDNLSFLQRAFDKLWRLLQAQAGLIEAVRAGDVTAQALESVDAVSAAIKLDYLARQVPRAIEQSREGLEQVGSVVKTMREFSHRSGAKREPCDIHELIESAAIVAKNEWRDVADLELDFDWNLPPLLLRRNELSQVMLSLIVNAAHSLADSSTQPSADKGKIKISTAVVGDHIDVRVAVASAGTEALRGTTFLLTFPLEPSAGPR